MWCRMKTCSSEWPWVTKEWDECRLPRQNRTPTSPSDPEDRDTRAAEKMVFLGDIQLSVKARR